MCLFTLLSLFTATSCVNNRYTLAEDNVDFKVTVFKEGVSLPLGSVKYSMGGILDSLGLTEQMSQYLQEGKDGAYTFCYGPETMDMSESLSSLSGAVDIKKIDLSRSVKFSLEGVDVNGIRYEGNEYGFEKDLSGELSGLDIDIPEVSSPFTIDADLRSRNLGNISLEMPGKKATPNFASLPKGFEIPAAIASLNKEMSLDELNGYLLKKISLNANVKDVELKTTLKNKFPKEVKSVSDIQLSKEAKIKLSVSLEDPFLTGGSLAPHLDIDLSSILKLENNGQSVVDNHIVDNFVLSKDKEWTVVKYYPIKGLNLSSEDWIQPDPNDPTSVLNINKPVVITVNGALNQEGLSTSPSALSDWMSRHTPDANGKRQLDVTVEIEFVDFKVADVAMEINPIEIERTEQFEILIPKMEFPSLVKNLEDVQFDTKNPISFRLSAKNLKGLGELDLMVEQLELQFPDKFIVEGADKDNKIIIDGANLRNTDLERDIKIAGYEIGGLDENGVVPEYKGIVNVFTKASIGGLIHTGKLPQKEEDDIILDGQVGGAMAIKDFKATLAGYEVSSETDPDLFTSEKIQIELPEALAEVNGLVVQLKNTPCIDIQITMPKTSFDVTPLGDGLAIYLPTMIAFDEGGAYEKYFDKSKYALVFPAGEAFPESVSLPVKSLVVNPEKGDDGKWYAKGEMKILGAVGIAEGVAVTKADIETLSEGDAMVEFKAVIPVLEPDVVEVDSYSTNLDMSFEFAPLKGVELPEMLASVGEILFDDVYLSLNLETGAGFPSIGDEGVLSLGLNMELPSFVTVDDERFVDGKLTISEEFSKTADGKLSLKLEPIKIGGLALNMTREELTELSDSIKIEGGVTLTGAALDLDDWTGKSHKIDVLADIKTIKNSDSQTETEKLVIESVTGYVDYQIDPVEVPIDLSSLASMQSGNLSATIDINTFYLALGVKTNLGVPVKADMSLIPYSGGKAKTPVSKELVLEPASSADEMKENKYWISNTAPLEGSGYKYLEIDLIDLLYADESKTTFIDSLKVSLVAGTDSSKECKFEPNASYSLVVDYVAGVPLEFGDDFKIEFRDTLANLNDLVTTIFSYGSIGLGGSAESTIPLNFGLTVNMLDAAGNVINYGDGKSSQIVKGCDATGAPQKSVLDFVLGVNKKDDMPDVEAVELIFSTDAKGAAGIPLNKDTYLGLILNARVPEGISADVMALLKDFLQSSAEQE